MADPSQPQTALGFAGVAGLLRFAPEVFPIVHILCIIPAYRGIRWMLKPGESHA